MHRIVFVLGLITSLSFAEASTLEEFNASLPVQGVGFKEYSKSLYTGFAPKVQNPKRIHFRVARGNQARLTAVLDDQTVLTYLYYLRKRHDVLGTALSSHFITPIYENTINFHQGVIEDPLYGVQAAIDAYEKASDSASTQTLNLNSEKSLSPRAALYEKSLEVLSQLNPGRVFNISLDLNVVLQKWKISLSAASASKLSSTKALELANEALPGRLNLMKLSSEQSAALTSVIQSLNGSETEYLTQAQTFLKSIVGDRYSFNSLQDGELKPALQCASLESCTLRYPEFTAIYPVGSAKSTQDDGRGNKIPHHGTEGMFYFYDSGRGVEHLTGVGYYGWAPKMNFQDAGGGEANGIHNPAVRQFRDSKFSKLFEHLGISSEYDQMWVVSRGPVSHGCTRMPQYGIWEVRQVFPALSSEMSQLGYFGSRSEDFDLFDIDGDGQKEVMGVQYYIAYAAQGDSGEDYRNASDTLADPLVKDSYYGFLYGKGKTPPYKKSEDGKYMFQNPSYSIFELKSGRETPSRSGSPGATAVGVQASGDFPLYEQEYEREKVQFVSSKVRGDVLKLFGQVSACGPFAAEFPGCAAAEQAFQAQWNQLSK